MDPNELVTIGRIAGTHGYKGTVKVVPLTDFPERFQGLQQVYLNQAGVVRPVTVESAVPHNKMILVNLRGVESKEDAHAFRGALLMVEEKMFIHCRREYIITFNWLVCRSLIPNTAYWVNWPRFWKQEPTMFI